MAYNNNLRPYNAPGRPYNGHQHPQYTSPQQYEQGWYYHGMDEQNLAYGDHNLYDQRPRYPDQQYQQPYVDLNRGPRHLDQQKNNYYTESPGYGGTRDQPAPQFGPCSPQSGYRETPMSQPLPRSDYPTMNGYNVAQRQQPQQQPQYPGPNAYYELPPQQAAGLYSRQEGFRVPEGPQPQLRSYGHEGGYIDDRKQRPAIDVPDPSGTRRSHERTTQVTPHGYVPNDLSGTESRANVITPSYPTQSPRVKKVQPIKPAKQRILARSSSPETLSWDNPFPTFPVNKKKAASSEGESLHGGLAGINLKGDEAPREGSLDKRPETASSKNSYASSRGYERHDGGSSQDHRNGVRPNTSGNSNLVDTQQYSSSQYHQNTQRLGFGSRNTQASGAEWRNIGNGKSVTQPVQKSYPFNQNQRFNQTQAGSDFPADVAISPGQQRSRTMPNGTAEAYISPGLQVGLHGQAARSEPNPTAGYGSPEGRGYLPKPPIRSSDLEPIVSPRPRSTDYVPFHSYGDRQTGHPLQRPPHSRHESYGELFDSYYNMPQDHQLTQNRSGGSHHQHAFDKDMQNSSAMPEESSGEKQGLTTDGYSRVAAQHKAPGVPRMPTYNHNDNAKASYQYPIFAAQAHRSRSQPDLRQHRQPKETYNGGFNFGLDGEVQNVASVPPRMNQFSPRPGPHPDPRYNRSHFDNPASIHNGQHQDLPARLMKSEAEAAGLPHDNTARFPDGSMRDNGQANHHHRTDPQNNGQSRQDTLPGFQGQSPRYNERSVSGQGRCPANGSSPISRTGPTTPPTRLPSNQDALPPHPAPVRPGLMPASVVSQNPKPPPVRQYDGGSSSVQQMPAPMSNQAPKPVPVRQYNTGALTLQQADVTQQTVPPISSREGGSSAAVTQEELERLRQAVKANPSDQKIQLALAKKMVEAASVLADEGGRADQKTKTKNREKYILDAHKLVKKLVYGGYPEAMFYLADCRGRGLLGLEPDTKEAFNLYQSAAKAGHAQSAYRVAVCCELGQEEGGGTRRDPLKAIQWYKRAATLGDTPAMYKMGMIQLKGLLGQPKNPREAIGWLKRAADRADEENPHALHELGLLYETASGNDSIIRDEAYSKQLFTQAADLGYKFSQYRLGCAYEYGLMGCPIDPRQSIVWYSRAAVQEEHQSELALSGWYLTGSEGVLQQSDTEAYLWARKAAQAGLAKAEYAMGYFTEVGIGAPTNIEDAKRWYWRAASQNFPKARERLEDLRKGGAKMQKSKTIARSAVDRRSDGECSIM